MNDNVKSAELRRRMMDAAVYYRDNWYPLPIDFDFPGLDVRVTAAKIVSPQDTQPIKAEEPPRGNE